MSPEFWLSLAVVGLLLAAAVAQSLSWAGLRSASRRWDLVIPALRTLAGAVLVVALALGLVGHRVGMPLTILQVAQAVSLAALLFLLLLWGRYRFDGAGPAADLLVVALVAVGLGAAGPAGPVLDCAQCTIPARVQGTLFLAGAGGATVMAGSGLVLALRVLVVRQGSDRSIPGRAELHSFMKAATVLTLVLLGCGLLVGVWWTWRVLGRLVGDDLHWGWMAAAWLFALIGWLAWRLSPRAEPVIVAFALLAALTADVGVLVAQQLPHWFGF